MLIDLITIPIFGFISYVFTQAPKSVAFNRLDIALVIVLILVANMHGAFGFIGIGDFRMYTSPILQGIIGGILIKRMTRRIVPTL